MAARGKSIVPKAERRVFGSGRPFVATGGLAEPLRLGNPTTIVPGDRVTHFVYDVCTG